MLKIRSSKAAVLLDSCYVLIVRFIKQKAFIISEITRIIVIRHHYLCFKKVAIIDRWSLYWKLWFLTGCSFSEIEPSRRIHLMILIKVLKLGSAVFYEIFISHQMIALQKLWKILLFHLKSSFRSRDIHIFVFPSSPFFLPVSHCFRGWWKRNLKVFDVISCLNKNLIKHFVWYLKKGKRYDIDWNFVHW